MSPFPSYLDLLNRLVSALWPQRHTLPHEHNSFLSAISPIFSTTVSAQGFPWRSLSPPTLLRSTFPTTSWYKTPPPPQGIPSVPALPGFPAHSPNFSHLEDYIRFLSVGPSTLGPLFAVQSRLEAVAAGKGRKAALRTSTYTITR